MKRPPRRQVTLPGGFLIEVLYKSQKWFARYAGGDLLGFWEIDRKRSGRGRIVINRDIPLWTQMRTFSHELIHAVNDYDHWVGQLAGQVHEEARATAKALEDEEED